MYKIPLLSLLVLFCSCNAPKQELLHTMEEIKQLGDSNPKLALEKLDSISGPIDLEPLHSRMKYQLLRIRLQDKSYVVPESDKQIQGILPYFTENGNAREKQEALFYAGSVYRDLKDTPRSLDFFLKSKDMAEAAGLDCDSLMLRNTYSNLCYLFGWEHDNTSTLEYAQKEYEIASELGQIVVNNVMHMGDALFACDSIDAALPYYESVLSELESVVPIIPNTQNRNRADRLLYIFSYNGELENAERCIKLLEPIEPNAQTSVPELFALGEYYRVNNMYDDAIRCNQLILEKEEESVYSYDASRYLFHLFRKKGNAMKALEYGDLFIKISFDLNLGKRQEMAATVNNIYKYNRDKEAEQKLIQENRAYQEKIQRLILCGIILLGMVTLTIVYFRYVQLKKILRLKGMLDNTHKEKETLSEKLRDKQAELVSTQEALDLVTSDLKEAKQSLTDKIAQNKTIISLLHQSELGNNAEDIIQSFKKSGDGVTKLTEKEWDRFYSAVDSLWPEFKQEICQMLGNVTEQQIQVCYLMRAGFSNTQIQKMTGLSRVTVWRWMKRYEWVYSVV